jgi:arginine exporter protein ArgO
MTRFMVLAFIMILGAAFSRLLPHPPNFTPIAAIALVGGAYLDKRFAFIVLHRLMPFVYGSFIITGGIGLWLRSKRQVLPVLGATLASSLIFYVLTNAGVWLTSALYPKTIEGLLECYIAALPFFRNEVVGNLVYSTLLFAVFERMQNKLLSPQLVSGVMKTH